MSDEEDCSVSVTTPRFTLVAAVNNRKTLEANLLASPALADRRDVQLLFKEGFASAAKAYNSGLDDAENDIVVFLHQDIYLPKHWFEHVTQAIQTLDASHAKWGVLGSFGSRRGAAGGLGRMYATGLGFHGVPISAPEPVETLDEVVLILRKSSGLRFDEELPHFHMYGPAICLQARHAGFTNFAIPAFCVHNTNQLIVLPKEFFEGYRFIKKKWRQYLPIYTSCMTISRFDNELLKRHAQLALARLRGRLPKPLVRIDDPATIATSDEFALHAAPPSRSSSGRTRSSL
jgi:hypothetical protein